MITIFNPIYVSRGGVWWVGGVVCVCVCVGGGGGGALTRMSLRLVKQ